MRRRAGVGTVCAALALLGCGGAEATAVISAVEGAAVPRGELEATGISMIGFDPPLGVDVILEFHDAEPCTVVTVDLCNLDDEGPFDLGRGFLECDTGSSMFAPSQAADVQLSTGCPDGPWGHWRATTGTVRLIADDETVHLTVGADMVPEFSGDSGTFTLRASADLDREDLHVVGE